jgi:hypothetical protein
MDKEDIIKRKAKTLKSWVGLGLSIEECESFVGDVVDQVESAINNEVLDPVIWRCDEDVIDEDYIKVFTKGSEYPQIPTGLLWVIDDEGHTHDIKKYKFTSI